MILILDNHDSYTYNLFQLLQEQTGRKVRVISSTDADVAVELIEGDTVTGVVISPGPGHPGNDADFAGADAVLDAALARPDLPVLGVCLGHQGLARRFGFAVEHAPEPRHGQLSPIDHTGDGLFAGLPQRVRVTRYHSLAITAPGRRGALRPGDRIGAVRITAVGDDGVVQAFEVPGHPWSGVQFHPESVATEHGRDLLANFVALVDERAGAPSGNARHSATPTGSRRADGTRASGPDSTADPNRHLATRRERVDPDLARSLIEWKLLARGAGSFCIELPARDGVAPGCILLGDALDVTGEGEAEVRRYRPGFVDVDTWPDGDRWVAPSRRRDACTDVFDDLHGRMSSIRPGRMRPLTELPVRGAFDDGHARSPSPSGLPFSGGYVGVLGYELGARRLDLPVAEASTPEAVWVRPVRFFLVDPEAGSLTVCVLAGDPELAEHAVNREVESFIAAAVRHCVGSREFVDQDWRARGGEGTRDWATHPAGSDPHVSPTEIDAGATAVEGTWRHDRAAYLERIDACTTSLRDGDSYELCLTNEFRVEASADPDPLDLFRELRRRNPAPYAALIEIDDDGEQLAIVGASPERFVRVIGDRVESKPIKGTAPRDPDPAIDAEIAARLAADPKAFAENLMIVDLIRNDLGRVCGTGSVEVASLMHVESYATVHQLVSTIRGRLAPTRTALDVVRALHPGGSMTGAPKERTVEILHRLEDGPRGFYSGALGVLGFDGRVELSIVIRTAVRANRRWTIGAGGAIVLDSDPDAEFEEVELKARAIREAFGAARTRDHLTRRSAVGRGTRPDDRPPRAG